jgi:LmbE family N-acetylglucosaminyl deacetylase
MAMQLEPKLEKPIKILVIGAHPDDIEFGTAGSTMKWTQAGAEVIYCIVTDGSAGSNKPDTDLRQLVIDREDEQRRAAEIVGVKDVRFLGYQDGVLQPTLELRRDLTRLIREIRPYRVVIMDPTTILIGGDEPGFDYINHPDHRATGEASLYAVFPSAGTRPIFPELLAEGYEPHDVRELYLGMSMKPNIAVDITDVIDYKIQALLQHRTQLDESAMDFVKQFDNMAGKEVGVEFAETYRVMRFGQDEEAPNPAAIAVANATAEVEKAT